MLDSNGAELAGQLNIDRPILHGPDGSARLTRRQVEVLRLAACGLRYKNIAANLGISSRTVQDRFREMRERTGARTRDELLFYAAKAGLMPPALEISDDVVKQATHSSTTSYPARFVSPQEVLGALSQVAGERDRLDCNERALIDLARHRGITWRTIGHALGLGSAQAAQQRRKRLGKAKPK
jgi:DNA-binding CsgD family transcriptional regulator